TFDGVDRSASQRGHPLRPEFQHRQDWQSPPTKIGGAHPVCDMRVAFRQPSIAAKYPGLRPGARRPDRSKPTPRWAYYARDKTIRENSKTCRNLQDSNELDSLIAVRSTLRGNAW